MITRHETHIDKLDVWAKLAATLPLDAIAWRQDGKAMQRDGKYVARFVCYIEAGTVRERLDTVVPGEWDLRIELLPQQQDEDGAPMVGFKAHINVLGVHREDVGQGKDYKSAATDAFKRAAVRFGIGHELYQMEQVWVQVDGDGKYAKALEDPAQVYARKSGAKGGVRPVAAAEVAPSGHAGGIPAPSTPPAAPLVSDEPSCPKCGGRLWDNRLSKTNPKAPDWKCRSRSCDGVIWPVKSGAKNGAKSEHRMGHIDGLDDDAPPPDDSDAPPF